MVNATKNKVVQAVDDVFDSIKTKVAGNGNSLLQATSKADALKLVESLPAEVQRSVKCFFKGGSNAYSEFTVEQAANGNYLVKMTKPSNVPGSKVVYYKEIGADGPTIKVYKDTFDPKVIWFIQRINKASKYGEVNAYD